MSDLSLAKIDVGNVLTGAGQLFKDIRTALTGKEPMSAEKAAQLALQSQEIESKIETTRLSVMVAEAASADKWTSRARPSFLYVMYVMILASIPMGIVYAVNPQTAANIITGVKTWLQAIPDSMWALMGVGYVGYVTSRSYDKSKGTAK
ncbi:hypothetical protein SMITH_199 [Smithella sp. ME-1]|uniref:Holin of 3TMs, for gene-transfer release n=1 Tax=hydrocarbon metagenome TaxID=938273 RepID=A0A0W8FQ16_9ZZZZ|nr:hypothetical protein SMITH_199 [Smithella sp. ME-1]